MKKSRLVILNLGVLLLMAVPTSGGQVIPNPGFEWHIYDTYPNLEWEGLSGGNTLGTIGTDDLGWPRNWVGELSLLRNKFQLRWQPMNGVDVTKFNGPSALNFEYEILYKEPEAFGIMIGSSNQRLFVFIGMGTSLLLPRDTDVSAKISNDQEMDGWQYIQTNVYNLWIGAGFPSTAQITEVGLFGYDNDEDQTGYPTWAYFDNINLLANEDGGSGGSGGGDSCIGRGPVQICS